MIATTVSPQGKPLLTIQALRAIAAISVVFKHTVLDVGNFGVDIFFVISGFIISYVASRDPTDFFARRLCRIVPLYWLGTLAVAGVAVVAPNLLRHPMRGLEDLLCSLLFIPYRSPNGFVEPVLFLGWTLNYEMFFYLIFAVSLWISKKYPFHLVLVAIVSAVLIGFCFHFDTVQYEFWTSPIMLEFCFGVILFKMWELKLIPAIRPGIAIVLAVIPMTILGVLEKQDFAGERFLWSGVPAFFVVMLALATEGRLAIPALLVMIGDASYSLYLFHPYLMIGVYKVLAALGNNIVLQYAVILPALALATGFALLCYRFVEKPSNDWLRSRLRMLHSAHPRTAGGMRDTV